MNGRVIIETKWVIYTPTFEAVANTHLNTNPNSVMKDKRIRLAIMSREQ